MDAPGPSPDDARALLAKDPKLRKGILGYAYTVTHDIHDARATAQEAMTRVLEGKGWYGWDPRGPKTLFSHLCSVVDTVVANQRARAGSRREISAHRVEAEGGPAYYEAAPDSSPNVEERAVAAEGHNDRMGLAELVMQRLDERSRAILRLEEQDISDAAEQAARLGCTVQEIYLARKRIAHHRDAVLAEQAKKGGKP